MMSCLSDIPQKLLLSHGLFCEALCLVPFISLLYSLFKDELAPSYLLVPWFPLISPCNAVVLFSCLVLGIHGCYSRTSDSVPRGELEAMDPVGRETLNRRGPAFATLNTVFFFYYLSLNM